MPEKLNALECSALEYAIRCAADASHGKGHLLRVLLSAGHLAAAYPRADESALRLACLLHDCAQAEQLADPSVHHASAGAEKAAAWLKAQGAGEATVEKVRRAIDAHSSHEAASGAGIEAQLLFDADKLDMCGAVGISRALMYALDKEEELYAEEGESLYSVHKADREFVEKNLFTPEARKIAKERLLLSRTFLEALKKECEGI